MTLLAGALPWVQIVLSVLLIIAIILQRSGAELGGAFGGDGSPIAYARRGAERTLFNATIVLAVLFVLANILALFIG
jgi:preprotein translocase subunit SecG